MGTQRLRDRKQLAYSHPARKWQSWIQIRAAWPMNHPSGIGLHCTDEAQMSHQDLLALSSLHLGLLTTHTCNSTCGLTSWLQEQVGPTSAGQGTPQKAATSRRQKLSCWMILQFRAPQLGTPP